MNHSILPTIKDLAAKRFDFGIKFEYARQHIHFGRATEPIKGLYLSHLLTWNSFNEPPYKDSPKSFISSFENLINGARSPSFSGFVDPLPVSLQGHLVNGVHRLSVAAAVNRPDIVRFEKIDSPYRYDYEFFNHYQNIHTRSRFSQSLLRSLEELYFNAASQDYYFITPKAIAEDSGRRALDLINKSHHILRIVRIRVPKSLVPLCVAHMYWSQEWMRKGLSAYKGSNLEYKVNNLMALENPQDFVLVLVSKSSLEQKAKIKESIRSSYRSGQDAVHSGDTSTDTKVLGLFVSTLSNVSKSIATLDYFNPALASINEIANRDPTPNPDRAITGSFLLGLNNLRKINDIDTLAYGSIEGSHNTYSYLYGQSIESILYRRKNYFYLFGVKVLIPAIIVEFKATRNEPKDLLDLELLKSRLLA